MSDNPIQISHNAFLRYLERVAGIDIDAHRKEMERIVAAAEDHEACCGVTSNGFRYKIVERTVVTVMSLKPKRATRVKHK